MKANYFLKELGFDQLQTKLPYDIQGKIVGIDKVYYTGDLPAIFFKKVNNFEPEVLKEIAELQKQIWNNSSVVFLYVTSSSEIRIYNCNEKPVYLPKDETTNYEKILENILIDYCIKTDTQKLEQLKNVFSAIAIDSGSIWTNELNYAKKIKLQTKVDSYLVKSLISLAKKLKEDVDNEELIHAVLMRSIFIMYLQDRGAIPQKIWDDVGNNDFITILDDHHKTYKLFSIISKNFNGNAFPVSVSEEKIITANHLKHIKHCLIDGNINTKQQKLFSWRLFDFSLIRIEMLSEIYESFLSAFNPSQKKITGTYYTPPSLVELVLNNILPATETGYNKKVLDPACGSGIFLAGAYKRLVKRWINETKKQPVFEDLSKLLTDNIFGVEWDKKSIKVTAFSLYLSMLDFLDPKDVWLEKGKLFPDLICDDDNSDTKGNNLFRTDTIKPNGKFEKIKYDIIVGNPPFGTTGLKKTIKDYCAKYSFDTQYVIPFIHKSAQLAENGKIALLFNTKILTNNKSTAQNFREWLFNKNYVEKIYNLSILRKAPSDFGGHLFSSATVPVSIVFYQKGNPVNPSGTIEYWAPTTFIKSHVAEGVIVDSTDIKYLPRAVCQQPNSKIWKIAQWGTLSDYFLINSYEQNLQSFFDNNNFKYGVGLELSSPQNIPNKDIKKISHLSVKNLFPYKTNTNRFVSIDNDYFRRTGDMEAYKAPHMIFKEGITKDNKDIKVFATYCENDCSFYKGLVGIHSEDVDLLKVLTAYINSTFCKYYLYLTASSWGIERDVIKYNELFELPDILSTDNERLKQEIINAVDEIRSEITKNSLKIDFKESEIDTLIYKCLGLNKQQIILIEDMVEYKFSLFYDKENSIALKPIAHKQSETVPYAKMLCSEINNFFKAGDLNVNARVYNVSPYTPLCMVVIYFVNKNKVEAPVLVEANNEFQKNLDAINKYTITEYSQSIYVRKQVRYYTDDTIYIAKPNQKRFWTRSQAIDDAATIINELMNKAIDENE